MKRVWQHPDESNPGRRYWRSLGEYSNTPEFAEKIGREFDPALSTMTDEERETSRRDFVKLMGGAAALAGLTLTGCRRPLAKIVPFTKHVEWVVPGKPLLYATAMPRPWGASPMVVVTHEGRPTHLQGNPLHPSGAGLDIFAQASIVDLYAPERAKQPALKGKELPWTEFQGAVDKWSAAWKKDGGNGIALLLSPGSSATRAGLLAEFSKAFPKAKLFEYEPVQKRGYDAAVKALLGEGVRVLPKFSKADRVFSLDCDFIGLDTPSESAVRDFMKRRAPKAPEDVMNRLYILENRYTLTGGISDHRLPVAASQIPIAAAVLAEEVGKLAGDAALQKASAALAGVASAELRAWIIPAAKDLFENRGKSLVLAGPRHGEAVQALALGINHALGAFGATIETLKVDPGYQAADLAELKADIAARKVAHLLVLADTDPAYDGGGFLETIKKLEPDARPELTHLTDRPKATTRLSNWALPRAHYLESWDDVRCADGCYSVVQPMIQPLFNGISVNELLLLLLGRKTFAAPAKAAPGAGPAAPAAPETDPAAEAVKATFAKIAGGASDEKWNNTLRDGFLPGTAFPKAAASFNSGALAGLTAKAEKPAALSAEAMEVVLATDASVYDGRFTDNPWLQEAPDPITKLAWDNAAWMSPRTFAALKLKKDGDLIEVKVGDKSLKVPALAAPGHAANSITIPLGYGQKSSSVVGDRRGVDAYPLAGANGDMILTGATVSRSGGSYLLAITQENYTMEGRAQVREGTKDRFDKNEHFAAHEGLDAHAPPNIPLYQGRVGSNDPGRKDFNINGNGFDYLHEHQWGMVIDLAKCIGCSACVVACQSENNIPVVGKDQVAKGRVMHWIRMDRYFATPDGVDSNPTLDDLDNPEMVSQPVACQQCESAPCETVCPVNATVHTEDGLNAMAYNRCIGTRYCANNCPYTARRFNWFDYNKRNPLITTKVAGIETNNLYAGPLGERNQVEVTKLQKNPNVTVRMRGVIEKCTYCVQRIESAKITQRRVARDDAGKLRIPADAVKTACQASCPAEAIMFGDLANEKSGVNAWKANPRNYEVLKYIGTRPRTSYLARIRNVNPLMPDDRKVKTGEASSNGV
jgi:MoCo/4Fe-4S cofactor protein with predicted Tat translocation signal